MSMLDLTRDQLNKLDALTPGVNTHIQNIINAIPFQTVPYHMKATIAVAHITNFAAQFRRNIILWDDTIVPVNAISFIISGSGAGKDSTNRTAQKCFFAGFDMIESHRKSLVTRQAIQDATDAGEDQATEYEIYKSYLKPIPPINMSVTTGPGLIQHINDIGALPISSSFLYSGEFSDELAYNQDMMENIKILSEVYDLGIKESKYTKAAEHRSKSIEGQPVSALLVGSPGHILYDKATKDKFYVAFMSKLARRSWFCYAPDRIPEPTFDSVEEMIEYEESIELQAKHARASLTDYVKHITEFGIATLGNNITVSNDVAKLFKVYKRYNSDLIDTLPNQDSTYALIRRHLQWKSLKLAAALAIMDCSNQIELHHYVDAIRFCELLDNDMLQFERDLNKATHERFSDYVHTLPLVDGRILINVHDIKKNGFINGTTLAKLQELAHLCSGYDTTGIYSVVPDGSAIQYEAIIKTDVIGISFKPINCTELNRAVSSHDLDAIRTAKHNIAVTTAYGFEVADTTFADLSQLLEGDFAYSPFKFRNGTRSKDSLIPSTKWIVLDVDSSPLSIDEVHFMLSDLNHHIALSSDPTNDYKFRVLIELDAPVELSAIAYKHFYLAIANDLGIRVDPLPQSQVFYSYADRRVLSTLDATPLEVHRYLSFAKEQESVKEAKARSLTSAQSRALLDNPESTFHYAYEATNGNGSRNIIRAMYHLKDLGGTQAEALALFEDIMEYWIQPFEPTRQELLRTQIKRMF